jgi:hypothetical protein
MKQRTCLICHKVLAEALGPKVNVHPACILFDDTPAQDPLAIRLKARIIEVIRWAEANSPRSQQTRIGPSEMGDPCERRIGYRIAEVPEVNDRFDPWAAIVGTSIHSWLDAAFQAYSLARGSTSWLTETPVSISEIIGGRSDLFNLEEACVIDHKGAGPSVMKKVVKDGPGVGYVVQIQLYGYGYEQLGYEVKKVALAFYPRAGWLRDMYVWTADYDRDVALGALERVSRIASEVMSLEILKEGHGHRWEQVTAVPSDSCGFCPWYVPDRDSEVGANATGCPGR